MQSCSNTLKNKNKKGLREEDSLSMQSIFWWISIWSTWNAQKITGSKRTPHFQKEVLIEQEKCCKAYLSEVLETGWYSKK